MTSAPRVIVVDDELDVREMIAEYLAAQGMAVDTAANAEEFRALLMRQHADVCILDVRMPGEDGLSLARYVREHHDMGIIMLTAADDVVDRVIGLEIGADDYMCKPFDLRELLARIKSVARRASAKHGAVSAPPASETSQGIPFGRCVFDPDNHSLRTSDGEIVTLTRMEFDLLKAFSAHPNKVLSRDQLLDLAHHRDWEPFDRSIDIRIARLRRKIEVDPQHPQTIKTIRGSGYMYIPDGR